jgi:beta-galactosidase/beta-glucuronidase
VRVYLNGKKEQNLQLTAELRDGSHVIATRKEDLKVGESQDVILTNLGQVEPWDIDKPKLYDVRVTINGRQ